METSAGEGEEEEEEEQRRRSGVDVCQDGTGATEDVVTWDAE